MTPGVHALYPPGLKFRNTCKHWIGGWFRLYFLKVELDLDGPKLE